MGSTTPFVERVRERDVAVGVLGLGYVGLPLAIAYAESGFRVIGFDPATQKIEGLLEGTSHIDDVSAERVQRAINSAHFLPTAEPEQLKEGDVIFICVPTPFDESKTPDLSFVCAATGTVRDVLSPGMLVILQSTTYPGTTVEVVQPMLEESGLRAGDDFHLAFSPERVDPGNEVWTVHNTPKVVGGVTPEGTQRACAVLEAVMDGQAQVVGVSSPAAAEMAKLLENTYRAVNIALVNELAILAHEMKLDLWEVIDAAATKPFGFQAFYPSVGPGGHCIPVDPYYLSWKARAHDFQTKFIELAADTNLGMARYVVQRVAAFMNRLGLPLRGARVLCLGAAFKGGVADIRNSRAIRVMELLVEAGCDVAFADPLVPAIPLAGGTRDRVVLTDAELAQSDLVVVLTGSMSWPRTELEATPTPVFDAVNLLGAPTSPRRDRL